MIGFFFLLLCRAGVCLLLNTFAPFGFFLTSTTLSLFGSYIEDEQV